MNRVYLLLGSNKGNRIQLLSLAGKLIAINAGSIIQQSPVYLTEAWGKTNQAAFLNQGLEIQTPYSPFQLLKILQNIEKMLGRTNKNMNAARTIDIDILFYNDWILTSKNLIIPHPRLHLRNFTLQPMFFMNKSYTHPVFGKSIEQLLLACEDKGKVSIFTPKSAEAKL